MQQQLIPVNESIGKYHVRAKKHLMRTDFLDIVATFPKLQSKVSDNPENPENNSGPKESYWNELSQDAKMEANKSRSIQRTKSKVKRYMINQNMKYMWTLTFAKKYTKLPVGKKRTKPPEAYKTPMKYRTFDAGVLKDAWHLWKMFLQRCERAGIKFKYVVTIEVQEERLKNHGEKVYHFHFGTNMNLPKNMKYAKKRGMKTCIEQLWPHGSSYVKGQKSKKKFANTYIMKYITKNFEELGAGVQKYRCSEGMEWPIENVWFASEGHLDTWVRKYCMFHDLDFYKCYFPMSDGHNEVLYYSLFPEDDPNNVKPFQKKPVLITEGL